MEEIESMGIKQLKEFISSRGGDFADCVEKSDLRKRAMQVAANPIKSAVPASTATVVTPGNAKTATPSKAINGASSSRPSNGSHSSSPQKPAERLATDDDFVDENADISSSDEEEEEPEGKPGEKKNQKRFSVFRVKKFVTSKIGRTGAGRATVMKVLGEDGSIIVQALKSITTNLKDAKTAKENKKDAIRFCLKAYNLWKHKDLTPEATRPMQGDAQLLAEIFCRECASVTNGRKSEVSSLVRLANRLHDGCMQLMTPYIQPKNAARLSELLKFYSTKEFFDAILNNPDNQDERDALEKSISTLLLPLQPILSGERERTTLARLQQLLRVLDNKRFEAVLDHPQMAQLFQQYLDLELGLASKNGLRFLLAVRDFEKTASRDLMKIRAPKIVERYLIPSAELHIDGIDANVIAETCENIAGGAIGMGIFSRVSDQIRKQLEDDYATHFVGSKDYMDYRDNVAQEIGRLEQQLREEGSFALTPAARTRKVVG